MNHDQITGVAYIITVVIKNVLKFLRQINIGK